MNASRSEDHGDKRKLEYERFDKFRQLIGTVSDEELPTVLLQPTQGLKIHWEFSDEMIKFMDTLCSHGYLKSLKFFHKQFKELDGLELRCEALEVSEGKEKLKQYCEALNKYCFGPKPLSTAISSGISKIVEYFLEGECEPFVQYFIHPPLDYPQHISCERGYLKAVEALLSAGLELSKDRGSALINSVCQCWDSYDSNAVCAKEEMKLDIVKKKMNILRMLLEAGHRSDRALHAVCEEQYCDLYRKPTGMLKLLIHYGADVHKIIDKNTALHLACHHLDQEKIKVLANSGADVNLPDHIGLTPIQICTFVKREHCLDNFTDDIIQFLHQEKGADIHVVSLYGGHNLLETACVYYSESKLSILLYYLSQGLTIQYKVFAQYLLQRCGMRSVRDQLSEPDVTEFLPFHDRELLCFLLMDNVVDLSELQSGNAGRLVLKLFDYHNENTHPRGEYMQPCLGMLKILHGAGFVIPLPTEIERELLQSSDETQHMTLKTLQHEMLRIPSLVELSRWAVRHMLGPGLISLKKVDNLPVPKKLVECILLVDILEIEHAQMLYHYLSGHGFQMACVTREKTDLDGEELYLECPECLFDDEDEIEEAGILHRHRERDEIRNWTAEFQERCQKDCDSKTQENILDKPEDLIGAVSMNK